MPSPTGIRLELTTRLGKGGQTQISDLLGRLGLAQESMPRRLKSRITLSEGHRRVDFIGPSPVGKNISMVTAPSGSLWIQHDAKVFVAVARPEEAKGRGAKAKAAAKKKVTADSPKQSQRPPQACCVVRDPQGRSVRIEATPNPEWRAPHLADEAVAALLGGAEGQLPPGFDAAGWARTFAERGFPSEIRIEVVDADGTAVDTLSTIEITGFEALPLEPGTFTSPRGYRKWRLGEKEPAGKETGYTAVPPTPVSGTSNVGVIRQGLDDDPQGPDGGTRPTPPPPPPPPPAFTDAPRIGLRIEQKMLDHISMLFNTVVTPIRTISIGQGTVTFDWLDQLRNDLLRRGGSQAGTAVLPLLHDIDLPARPVTPRPTPASDFGSYMCRGLIDQVAIRDAEQRFRAGTYPQTTIMTFAPSMKNVINAAGTNWDLLPDGVKARLTFELVRREYGTISFNFPTSTPPAGALGLINVMASGITGGLTLPPVPPVAVTGDPPFNPLLMLTAGAGATIDGTLSLGRFDLTAVITRWPTANYFLLLAGSGVVAALIPGLAWALGIVAGLAAFLSLDIVRASLTGTGLTAALRIRFVQDAQGVFVPSTSCTVSGMVIFGWQSQVPTGIHQILSAIEQAILNALAPTMLTALGDGIATAVQGALLGALGRGFPATALRLGLPIGGGARGGLTGQYTYLEARLDPSRDARYQSPGVMTPTNLEAAQKADAARAVPGLGADPYGSLSFDENFLGLTLRGMQLNGLFDGRWMPAAATALRPLMPAPISRSKVTRARLYAEAGPTMTLASSVAGAPTSHGTIQFQYVLSLTENNGQPVATIRFRVNTTADLVLGSAAYPGEGGGLVQIQTLANRAFDLLVQQSGAVITPTSFDSITSQEIRTTSIDYDDNGKPHKVVEVDFVETSTPVPLTAATIQALEPLLRRVLNDVWWYRNPQRAPRADGVVPNNSAAFPIEPLTKFRYPFGGLDPDTLDVEPHARADLGLERRLAHFHLGHAGLATTALMPVRTGSAMPFLATFTATNSVPGILGGVRVQASTTSNRDLML